MSLDPAPLLFGAAALLSGLAGLYSAADVAVDRLTRAQLAEAETNGERGTARLVEFVEQRAVALAGVAGARYLCETVGAVALALAFGRVLDEWWLAGLATFAVLILLAALFSLIGVTRWGRRHPVAVARRLRLAIAVPMRFVTVSAMRLEKFSPPATTDVEAREEIADDLRELVDRVGEAEGFAEEDRQMLRGVFELGQTLAHEVMVPRPDMVSVESETSLTEALGVFVRSGFSRLPMVDAAADVVGLVYFKDLVHHLHYHPEAHARPVRDIARTPFFVPEFVPADDLLRQMQANSRHAAVLVDEYGGVAGLVTIEDLLEELVGELTDEHDRAEPEVEDLGAGTWRVPARLPIDELGELFGLDIDDDDVETAGGLLTKALGRLPLAGDRACALGVCLEAEALGGRRHQLVSLLATRDEEEDDAVSV
ncbi:hemolysin family protein [Buchananella hordeovulneris]|uniref:hemolysin family protein n=1 Tax=Buchananella hordeovulneris TaxID=52770 RepID=UPI0026DD6439|nr:hemolysin family protein [Buchananella hordeovulneris]MDO5080385.1 hemolysin family protein [Buchananella hordeovulneris]